MIRVLVVDDSALVRRALSDALSRHSDIEVVGTAADAYAARDLIVELDPDVITLDIEMPRMDGLSFLEKLMEHRPLPVVIVSSLAPENSATALRALRLGAVDVVAKPGSQITIPDVSRRLVQALRAAAQAKPERALGALPQEARRTTGTGGAVARLATRGDRRIATRGGKVEVIALGASTGGTRALESVLKSLPADAPGIVIVQHMPSGFTAGFARSLDRLCDLEVREADQGDVLHPGRALLAPGGSHLMLMGGEQGYRVNLKQGPPVHFQRPSVDVLFSSVARVVGDRALGALLTGMGRDGGQGLLEMRQAGALTLAQDEASCVVFGMPKEAVRLGAAEHVLPLDEIPAAILRACAASVPTP